MSQQAEQSGHLSLIDTHCHLDDDAFGTDLSLVLDRARHSGVEGFIVPGVIAAHWSRILDLATKWPDVHSVLGLHPCFVENHQLQDLDTLDTMFAEPDQTRGRIIGIGECGLDYYIENPDKIQQLQYFERQLIIAKKNELPIVIHARKSVEDVILTIRKSGHHRGMVHSYNGSYVQATRLMDLGYLFSFGGAITHTRAVKLRKLVSSLPLDALLLETDAPFQPDAACKNPESEPARLKHVFNTVCQLRSESKEEIAFATTRNAQKLFGIGIYDSD